MLPNYVTGGMNRTVVLLYCSGAFFESIGEPLFNLYNQSFRVDCRLKADAAAILIRSVVTFTAIIVYDLGVVGFGLAQLSYGIVHVVVMLWSYTQVEFTADGTLQGYRLTLNDLIPCVPSRKEKEHFLDFLFGAETTGNVIHMTGTSLLKHGLTEADKIALSLSNSATHYDQGVYGVINNYGSLVARMIFQPIEETARITFSKMAAKAKLEETQGNRDLVKAEVSAMSTLVSIVLKTVGLFSVLFPVFGPFYARIAVQYCLGSRWYSEDTVQSLAVYCVYVLTLGLNGVSEAFVYATAPSGVLGTVNVSLVVSSVVFCSSAVLLIERMGTSGILVANILSMAIRIVFNLVYTHRYFASPERYFPLSFSTITTEAEDEPFNAKLSPLQDACIRPLDLAGMVIVAAVMRLSGARYETSAMTLSDAAQHISVGIACFVVIVMLLYTSHGHAFVKLLNTVRDSKKYYATDDEVEDTNAKNKKKNKTE